MQIRENIFATPGNKAGMRKNGVKPVNRLILSAPAVLRNCRQFCTNANRVVLRIAALMWMVLPRRPPQADLQRLAQVTGDWYGVCYNNWERRDRLAEVCDSRKLRSRCLRASISSQLSTEVIMTTGSVCPFYGKNDDLCDVGCDYISSYDVNMIIKFCSCRYRVCPKYQELTDRLPAAVPDLQPGPA
jgi:hypothetical protein